ncbi:hypothetical protein ONZ45_g8335 [Pleurotus djamor]|nr:hypothetical protein ONZ45_g8335 [Pleurotus djamor]
MPKLSPSTRERLDDPPPVARTLASSPKPHRICAYGYAWRIPLKEIRQNLTHYGPQYNTPDPDVLERCIQEQWEAQGYAKRFGEEACAEVLLIPDYDAEFEVFIQVFSNSSQERINKSQAQPEADYILQAVREVARISGDSDLTLKWHRYNPVARHKPHA